MGDKTEIEWADATWNPVRGCSMVSSGCRSCYAMAVAYRFSGPGLPYEGLTHIAGGRPAWNGAIRLVPDKLDQPLRWRDPKRVFVNSMSDLFHEGVPFEFVAAVFGVMAAASKHTFQVLTKRPERMVEFFEALSPGGKHALDMIGSAAIGAGVCDTYFCNDYPAWPPPNIWLGVSVEDQQSASRIVDLLRCPAAVHFVSAEPLLGPLRLTEYMGDLGAVRPLDVPVGAVMLLEGVDWVIVGGESGANSRPCSVRWIRNIVQQCKILKTPCFVKQLGAHYIDETNGVGGVQAKHPAVAPLIRRLKHRKGGDPGEWPIELRVRQWPNGS